MTEYSKEFVLQDARVTLTIEPSTKDAPRLLDSGILKAKYCFLNQQEEYVLTLSLQKAAIPGFQSARITTEKQTTHYFSVEDVSLFVPSVSGSSSRLNAELCVEELLNGIRSTNKFPIRIDILPLGVEPPRAETRSRSVLPPIRSRQEPLKPWPERTLPLTEDPSRNSPHNRPEQDSGLKEMAKIQNQLGQLDTQIKALSTRLIGLDQKIQTLLPLAQANNQDALRVYVETLQKLFQDQAAKKTEEARRSLEAVESHPIIQAMDRLLAILQPSHVLHKNLSALCPAMNRPLGQLRTGLESLRHRFIPKAALDIPAFACKTDYSDFLQKQYKFYLLKNLSTDQETEAFAQSPEWIYRKWVWRTFKNSLDEFKPSFESRLDSEGLKQEWNAFLVDSFHIQLKNIEAVEEQAGISELSPLVDQLMTALLDPLDLALLPVRIGDSYDPQKHEKDPVRSLSSGSAVTRVLNRGIQFKNRNDIWATAKVTVG